MTDAWLAAQRAPEESELPSQQQTQQRRGLVMDPQHRGLQAGRRGQHTSALPICQSCCYTHDHPCLQYDCSLPQALSILNEKNLGVSPCRVLSRQCASCRGRSSMWAAAATSVHPPATPASRPTPVQL
jgi:hypothetical protein